MKTYDFLIVGAGLFGSVFAHLAGARGAACLVVDKRSHIGGNVYCEEIDGITVHKYGPHIFHTGNKKVWDFVNGFTEFNRFTNSPIANYKGEIYNLPFNMNTFHKLWGVVTPEEARRKIEEQREAAGVQTPSNLEEQAISLVGTEIYEKLIKSYTQKQWGIEPRELPAFIIKRLPVRFTYDNNYFNDPYQGVGDYNALVEQLLAGSDVALNTDFLADKSLTRRAERIVFTGRIDEFYGFRYDPLDYRSLRFETETLDISNYQGNAVVNYTDEKTPYTRIIEHKHFVYGRQENTVITREYPVLFQEGREPYYPVNDEKNNALYAKYRALAEEEKNVLFGGRLGEYRYYDMDKVIERAWEAADCFCDSAGAV